MDMIDPLTAEDRSLQRLGERQRRSGKRDNRRPDKRTDSSHDRTPEGGGLFGLNLPSLVVLAGMAAVVGGSFGLGVPWLGFVSLAVLIAAMGTEIMVEAVSDTVSNGSGEQPDAESSQISEDELAELEARAHQQLAEVDPEFARELQALSGTPDWEELLEKGECDIRKVRKKEGVDPGGGKVKRYINRIVDHSGRG